LTPFPDLTLTKSLVSSLDDQALIDGLVFEAWRTADEAWSWILGAELDVDVGCETKAAIHFIAGAKITGRRYDRNSQPSLSNTRT
jgi:hypothetical protein